MAVAHEPQPQAPAPVAGGPLGRLSVDSLQWVVGLFCGFIGTFLLVAPHQFYRPAFSRLVPYLPWWGAAVLAAGLALLATPVVRPHRGLVLVAHALASLTLAALAASFAASGLWGGVAHYVLLAAALLASGFLPGARRPLPAPSGELLAVSLGISAGISGILMLGLPHRFPIAEEVRPFLPPFGAAFLASGSLVAWVQLLPVRPALRWAAHLLAGCTFVTYGTFVALPARGWTGVAFYWGCGGALALLPWLRRRLAVVDPAAMGTRFALAFAIATWIALVVTVAVVAAQEEAIATRQARDTQQVEAGAIARNVGDYIDLNAARTAAVAATAVRAPLAPAAQDQLLEGALRSYPDVTALAIAGLDGRLTGSTGKFLPPPGMAEAAALEIVRQSRPAIQIWLVPGAGRQHLLLGAPARAADGRLAAVVLMLLDSEALARRIERAGSRVTLADGFGKQIAAVGPQTPEGPGSPGPLPDTWDRAVAKSGQGPSADGRISAFARVAKVRWAVAVDRDPALALAAARRGRDTAFLLLLLVVGLSAAAGIFLARRIARPLATLTGAVEELAAGNPGAPLAPSSVSEVSRLSAAFREMRGRLAARTRESEQLAAELRARAEALAESDRRKDEFLAMLAHELRNPLGAISNASYLMEQLQPGEPQMARSVAVVRRQTQHLTRMVDDLLDVSRITRGKVELRRQPVDLRDAVRHAVEATQPLIEERGHRLEVSLPAEPLALSADVTRLEQVFGNLLRNAAKYTEPGGRIVLAAVREDGEAVVRVSDDGIGIGPELLPRVFDMFTQGQQELDRAGAGLGIGLTLVRSLVEMHGGRVEAASDGPGHGSEFVVRLPLGVTEALEEAAAQPAGTDRRATS